MCPHAYYSVTLPLKQKTNGKLRAKKKKWEMASSSEGDVHGGGAGADPSLSAALAERIKGSTGVQRAGFVVL